MTGPMGERVGFQLVARKCADILARVLAGEIGDKSQLLTQWPQEAEGYTVMDGVRDDVFEYWVLAPRVCYRDVLEAEMNVLSQAGDDPAALATALEVALEALS